MIYILAKRTFDIVFSILLLITLSIPMFIIAICIKFTSHGPVLFLSSRIGRDNKLFKMFKYRTMNTNTPQLATHLMSNPQSYLTPVGTFLRKYSLDEFPQLLNVLKGDMSFVGPRPALFNQDDLVELRTEKNIQTLVPGITGWAQMQGRDELSIPVKVDFDEYYLNHRCFLFDIRIIFFTIFKVIKKEDVCH